jgi:hypothetical protein
MAGIGKWKAGANPAGTPLTVFSGAAVNGLTNGSMSAASAEIDNSAALELFADLGLHLDSMTTTAGARIDIYILQALDGTNYPAVTAAVLRGQPSMLLCSIGLYVGTNAQDPTMRNLLLPPTKFKLVLDNQSGATLPAANTLLELITYNYDNNG